MSRFAGVAVGLCLLGTRSWGQDIVSQVGCPVPPEGCPVLYRPPLAGAAATQCAAPTLLPPLPPGYVLPEGTTWVNCVWSPDRRPAIFLQLVNPAGNKHRPGLGNSRGLFTEWYAPGTADVGTDLDNDGFKDETEFLISLMDKLYDEGFRRFILQAPAGATFGRPYVQQPSGIQLWGIQSFSMNQWGPLAQYKKDFFSNPLERWQAWIALRNQAPDPQFHVTMEIYLGAPVADGTCTLCLTPNQWSDDESDPQPRDVPFRVTPDGNGGWIVDSEIFWVSGCGQRLEGQDFDPRRADHVDYVFANLMPWRDAQITRFWLDAGSSNQDLPGRRSRWGSLELSYHPILRSLGCTFGIETIPTVNTLEVLDYCSIGKAPWMVVQSKAMRCPGDAEVCTAAQRDFYNSWWFSRATSEVHMLVDVGDLTFNELGLARDRGFVVTLESDKNERYRDLIKRWYSMGEIWIPDFDANGVVNQADLDLFNVWTDVQPFHFRVYANGDIDQDLQRTHTDRLMFEAAWNAEFGKSRIQANPAFLVDYGSPDDL